MADGWTAKRAALWASNRRIAWAFVAGAVAAGVLAAMGGLAIVEFGLFDIAAAQPDNRIVSWALHKTFKQSVRRRAGSGPAPSFMQAQVVAGFRQYQADCMMCHGGPGVARADWVKGLEPTPPFLLQAGEQWTPAQLTYILENGVKMSAMPSWGETRSGEQIQDLVAFIVALPGISPAQFARMQCQFPPVTLSGGPPVAPPQPDRGGMPVPNRTIALPIRIDRILIRKIAFADIYPILALRDHRAIAWRRIPFSPGFRQNNAPANGSPRLAASLILSNALVT